MSKNAETSVLFSKLEFVQTFSGKNNESLVTPQKISYLKIRVNKIPFQKIPRSKIAHDIRYHNETTKKLRIENKAVNRSNNNNIIM